MYPYVDEYPYPDDDRHPDDAPCPREYREPPAFPLDPLDISLARIEMARRIGKWPVSQDLEFARSLWVVFAGEWGIWTRAAIPLEDGIGTDDANRIAGACALVAELIGPPECYGFVIAGVVLRRPGPPKLSAADRRIFRLIRNVAAARDTVPWSFYISGPDGFRPLSTNAAR